MKLNINRVMKSTKHFVVKHSPEILTGIGIAGMITTTVLAVKATPKALEEIEGYKEANEIDGKVKPIDAVKGILQDK